MKEEKEKIKEKYWTDKDWKSFVGWMNKHSADLTCENMQVIEIGIRKDERRNIAKQIFDDIEKLDSDCLHEFLDCVVCNKEYQKTKKKWCK